jgi:hypothetical protein
VAYDPKDLAALGAALQSAALSPMEQASLIEDVWALVRLDEQNIAEFLSLSTQIVSAPLSPSITSALNRLNYISDHLIDGPQRPAFERWVRNALKPLVDELGTTAMPQESDERRTIRSAALYTLGYAGRDPLVLGEARRSVDMQLANAGNIDPSLASTYLQLAAVDGDQALYDNYFDQMKRATQGRQFQYRNALTYFSDPAMQQRTMDFATSSDTRTQDAPQILGSLFARPWASHGTWEYLKVNWTALEGRLAPIVFQGLPAVVGATNNFCDAATRDDISRFFEAHYTRGIDRPLRQSLETIDRCIQTRNQQAANLTAFLR